MSLYDDQESPSRAAIGGHPLHPMVVPFPIAFLVGTLVVDIVFRATSDPFWARAAFWLLAAGIVMGAVAALLGLVDFLSIRRVRSLPIAWMHFLGNGVAVLLAIWNIALRWSDPAAGSTGLAITLSAIVTVILIITGWLGGELAYRHRIGVMARTQK
ncbi:MAG TPA: DUF2231 domain-containing protein [Dongiaceae bacterium]|nr:DUF2231 domain-containing protein [Dongiaceae bacterium]